VNPASRDQGTGADLHLRCPTCGDLNRQGAHYCSRCGDALQPGGAAAPASSDKTQTMVTSCAHCGVPLRPGQKFCPNCGTAVPADLSADAVAAARAPGGTIVKMPVAGAVTPGGPGPDPGWVGQVAAVPLAPDAAARKLVAHWPGGRTVEHVLASPVVRPDGTARVGRAPDNDIVLGFSTVSGHHLLLQIATGEVQVTDLHSTNGTMLKGRRIPPGVPHIWQPGDTLRVGDLHGNSISMSLVGGGRPEVQNTRPLGMHGLSQYAQILIGRDPASQIHLAHPSISRRHAEIVRRGTQHLIRDLGSINGTFVNGTRVATEAPLAMGDVIQMGPYKLVYDGAAASLSTSISQGHRLDALGLGMQVSAGHMILNDISLSVQGSEFAALVGGSGAGKTTLLKAMNGFRRATHGRMLIDGVPLYPHLSAYRTLMGYVPQDDIIHRTLPVRTALRYSAKLRLPDATNAEIDRRIADVLDAVELAPHQHKPVRVLSGGQRKRVSIAVELLAEPDLLFLDEPTSGLDPGLEKKMMYDLNRLADQGRTIVLVTHATANIEQCDHVAFLVKGNLAYYGPPRDAMLFFQTRDFADIYLKLSEMVALDNDADVQLKVPAEIRSYVPLVRARESANGGADRVPAGILWAEHYRTSSAYQTYVRDRQQHLNVSPQASQGAPVVKPKRMRDSALRQLFILARRQFDLIRYDLRTLFILLVMMPLIAILFMAVSDTDALVGRRVTPQSLAQELLERLGAQSEGDLTAGDVGESVEYLPLRKANTLVTMLSLALTQAGTFGAAYEIVKERAIFRREKSVNLRVGAYVLSKALVLGSFAIIQVASVLIVLSFKLDMHFSAIMPIFPTGGIELFVTLLIAVVASIMFGLFISAVVPTPDVVLYVVLVQLFVQIVLSGTMFPLRNNPASSLVTSYWTMDAMGAIIDVERLNADSLICTVVEQRSVTPEGASGAQRQILCQSAARDELDLPYEHTEAHLLTTWMALGSQAVFWGLATMLVQSRVKTD
jgi:ABC transport system ATP-binding/permease protein